MTLHLKSPKYHCRECGRYFQHRFTGIKPRFRSSEGYRLEVFEAHHGGVTQAKLSRTHNISPATVERWYQHHNALKRAECANYTCPRVMGIDEHFFTRKKGFATTFVDLGKQKVFDVKLGRSEASLSSYLSKLRDRDKVQVMVMDLAGFAISAGSACSSGKVKASAVLTAMGFDTATASSAIRVSLGPQTTEDDVMRFAETWRTKWEKHRARAA